MSGQGGVQTRVRVHFGKHGPLRYTSHLDLARIWERLLRRAGVPVVYSQGFNPRPKIQLAAALPLGYSSTCEVLDVWLAQDSSSPLDDLTARLQAKAPQGLTVQRVELVNLRSPALQTLVRQAVYRITFDEITDLAKLRQAVADVLGAQQIIRERRNKRYDLRPLIIDLEVVEDNTVPAPLLLATLSLGEAATARPDELLAALGFEATAAHIERIAMHFADPQNT